MARFVAHLFNSGYAPSSVMSMVSAISFVHKLLKLPDPGQGVVVKRSLLGGRKLGRRQDSRLPITSVVLCDLIIASETLWTDGFARAQFKAMCSLAFHALLRVGEITASPNTLLVQDVLVSAHSLEIHFQHFKHSRGQVSRHVIQPSLDPHICPVRLLSEYLHVRGAVTGPLFTNRDGSAALRKDFCAQLKLALNWCGYPGDRYNTHSFRIGGATHMARLGASESQIRQAGRWASNAFLAYTRVHAV